MFTSVRRLRLTTVTTVPLLQCVVDEEPSSVTGRKDSLSINLEFVKVSLSRMRRSGGPTFIESFVPTKGGKIDTTLINISGTKGLFFPLLSRCI